MRCEAQSDQSSIQTHANCVGEILRLTPAEVESKKFHLRYNVISDTYCRLSDDSSETENWFSLVREYHNIKRLEDKDNKTVCLARSSNGTIRNPFFKKCLCSAHRGQLLEF